MPMQHDKGADRVTLITRGFGGAVSGVSGIIAAALAANSILFALRADPNNKVRLSLEQLRLMFTTLTAFTTPVTAARVLAVYRGSVAALTGGTALAIMNIDTSNLGPALAAGGVSDVRIANTAALTPGAFVREANPVESMTLADIGASGGYRELPIDFASPKSPLILNPGELVVVSNPVAMDAAGTFQLGVTVRWANGDQAL